MEAQPAKTRNWKNFYRKYRGFFYILPWIIGFMIFKFYPFIMSLFYSFTNYSLFKPGTEFVGLDNYLSIFHTKKYIKAFKVTFQYAFLTVPLKLAFSLFIAYILNFKLKFVKMFRTIYYIPSILGGSVAIAVVWKFIFQGDGLINQFIHALCALRHLSASCMAVRFRHGDLSRRVKGRSAGALRGRLHRRSRQMETVFLRHSTAYYAGYFL